jgi:membrane protease YdiL (CAAX protease family)
MSESKSVLRRIPVVVRAVVTGFVVQIVGVGPFMILAQLNLQHGRAVPWAALVEIGILWLLWRYLGGAGWPTSTSATRRRWLRAGAVDRMLLPATVTAGLFYGLTVGCLVVVSNLWMPMPPEAVAAVVELARAPALTAMATLLMIAVSAGLVEEAAFRGYMQVPIEERHGPAIAIGVVALAFALSHAPAGPILPVFVLGAVSWGLLARLSGSIVPGVIVHILVDATFLLWIWRRPEGLEEFLASAAEAPAGDPAVRTASLVTLSVALAAGASFWWLYRVGRSRGSRAAG